MPKVRLKHPATQSCMGILVGGKEHRFKIGENPWVEISDMDAKRCRKNRAFEVKGQEQKTKKPPKAARGE